MNFPLILSLTPEARPCSADLHPQSKVKMVLNRAPPRAPGHLPARSVGHDMAYKIADIALHVVHEVVK
jgi:hypothetical protein